MIIACDDLDFGFTDAEIDKFIEMWKSGHDGISIAKAVERKSDEVIILALHLSRRRRIKRREGAYMGSTQWTNG